MNIRRALLLVIGVVFGCLEAAILGAMPEFKALTHFVSGLVMFAILQIVLWILSSIFVKDKGGAKLATIAYFWAYVLFTFFRGVFLAVPFWSIVFEILVVFLISKSLPKLIFGIIYSRTRIFS